ncbi:MAG: hypothetical protein JWO37_339 [Acidimicrobiales bacterium]|nr:hypothetical protein [Acidimicrobiales bacterium]
MASEMTRRDRRIGVAVVTLLLLDSLALYQVGVRARRPPSFRRGGAFVRVLSSPPARGHGPFDPIATGDAPTTSSTAVTESASSAAAGSTAPTRRGLPLAPPAPAPSTACPALGTSTWAVQGTESATGFGSRSFPPTMTMVTHAGDGPVTDQVVVDITYSSDHTEREVLSCRPDGLAFSFEGGQVRFGPVAQTNQGDYRPPMTQVPLPLTAGLERTGRSDALDSSGGVQRTEDWTLRVLGQETLTIGGAPVVTWKVQIDRKTTANSSQQVDRSRTYWYDPARRFWVKYTERMHGQQHYGGITFTYDNALTATFLR